MPPKKKGKRVDSDEESDNNNNNTNKSDSDYDNERKSSSSRKRIKKTIDDDEEEDEYNPDNNHNNTGGGSDVESLGYGSDLMGDEADRAKIDGMTQLERENLLFERGEKRTAWLERQAAKQAERDKSNKNKAVASSTRGRTRGSTASGAGSKSKNDALADLLARKHGKLAGKITDSISYEDEEEFNELSEDSYYEEDDEPSRRNKKSKAKQRRQRAAAARQHQRDAEDLYLDEDSQNEADSSMEDNAKDIEAETSTDNLLPVRLQDIKNLQMRRVAFEKLIDEPYFKDIIIGMFVKLFVGMKDDGTQAYKLCEIIGVQDYKSKYKLPKTNKELKIGLLLKFGIGERIWPISQVSNESINENEFMRWLDEMKKYNLTPLSMQQAIERYNKFYELRNNFTYTPEILAAIIEEKKSKGLIKASNLASEKIRLQYALETAIQKKDIEQQQQLNKRLEEIEEQEKKVQVKKAAKNVFGILAINNKNKLIERQQLEEMVKLEKEEKKKQSQTGKVEELNAFKRRATRPEMNWHNDNDNENIDTKQPTPTVKTETKTDNNTTTNSKPPTIDTKSIIKSPTTNDIKSPSKIVTFNESNDDNAMQDELPNNSSMNSNLSSIIIPPSKVNPSLNQLNAPLLQFPTSQQAASLNPNLLILQSLHNSLNESGNNIIDINKNVDNDNINNNIIRNTLSQSEWNTIPKGHNNVISIADYWKRRDNEEDNELAA